MAKTTLRQQLEQAQAELQGALQKLTLAQSEAKASRETADRLVTEVNELRDQLMEVTLDRENMRGYLMRAAEDEPQPPIVPTPERRYASGPANSIDYSYHEFDGRNGYRSSNERPRRWYHR